MTLARRAASSTLPARWCVSSSSCFSRNRECASATPLPAQGVCSSTRPSMCGSTGETCATSPCTARSATWGHLPSASSTCCSTACGPRAWRAGDVIAEPGLVDPSGRLESYDRVIANPPFSLKNWGHDFAPNDPHHRFDRYGAIPPRTRGDLAFLLHMLGVTNSIGMVGVVMPHGVLFPGRCGGQDTPRNRGGRLVRGDHRPRAQPLLRGQHPRRHLAY